MNVVVKFLVVSAHFCPKKAAASEYLRIFFFFANKTFSNRFFLENRKPQTGPRDHGFCCRVCSLQFTFERQEGLPAGRDLRQGVLQLTIIQPHF